MGGANKEKREKMAQGMAEGLTPKAAAKRAGYTSSSIYHIPDDPEFQQRVEVLKAHLEWGGTRRLGPVIDELRDVALAARMLKSAAGMNAARGALVAAANLKQLLPKSEAEGDERELSLKEWAKRYGPKS